MSDNMKDLYYFLLNTLHLILSRSYSSCFCKDYQPAGMNKGCSFCRIQKEFSDFKKKLDNNQFSEQFSRSYYPKLYPFLMEIFHAKKSAI